MHEYQKYGYKFIIHRGYLFEKGYIFNNYVNDIYKIKKSKSKDDPMYLISKLLKISLYGKFGRINNLPYHNIISNDQLDKFITNLNEKKIF